MGKHKRRVQIPKSKEGLCAHVSLYAADNHRMSGYTMDTKRYKQWPNLMLLSSQFGVLFIKFVDSEQDREAAKVRDLLIFKLERAGCRVLLAVSAEEACGKIDALVNSSF